MAEINKTSSKRKFLHGFCADFQGCFEVLKHPISPLKRLVLPFTKSGFSPKRYLYVQPRTQSTPPPHHLRKTNTQFSFLPIKSAAPRFFCLLVAKNLHFSNRSMVQRQGTIGTCSSPRRNDDDALTRGGTLLQGPRVTCGKATRATS